VAHREDDPSNGEPPGVRFKHLLGSLTQEMEDFTRRKPLEGLLLSFIAGLLVGDLFRRRR